MNILRPCDIEEEIRLAMKNYMTVYVRPLPENFTTPCILISATGGTTSNTIDTFAVKLDSRAETDEEALAYIRTAIGLLEAQSCSQFGALRNVSINSLASWGNYPARPDSKLCTLTCQVTAHRESFNLN